MDKKLILVIAANIVLFIINRLIRKKKGWHSLLTVTLSILATLTIIECAYRFLLKKEAFVMHSNRSFGTYRNNPVTGYTLAQPGDIRQTKLTLGGDTIYSADYTIIPDSGRQAIDINHRAGYRLNRTDSAELVFLGCSITFGEGIQDDETFATQTGRLCQLNSLNLGLSGYGTHQAYQLFMHGYSHQADSTRRIFIYSFIPDHILRAKCIYPWDQNDPYFEVMGDSLHLLGPANRETSYARWHKYTRYLSLLYSFTFISDLEAAIVINKAAATVNESDYRRVFLMMKQMAETAKKQGNRFIVVYWDKYQWRGSNDETHLSRRRIETGFDQLRKEGVEVLPVSTMMNVNDSTLFIKGDGHPNARANRLVAEGISRVISKLAN